MMTSYFNLLKYAATGIAPPDMTYYDKMRASTLMGGVVQTLTGIPPLSFKADGSPLISWSMKGNGSQSGTPTPDAPIMPTFCGVRTGNLFDYSILVNDYTLNATTGLPYAFPKRIATLTSIDVSTLTSVTLTYQSEVTNTMFIYAVLSGSTLVSRVAGNHSGDVIDVSGGDNLYISFYSQPDNISTDKVSNIMLNLGSTALPYEPYGWKIPITCAGQIVPVYLGQTQTVRRIRKLVLDGTENVSYNARNDTNGRYVVTIPVLSGTTTPTNVICTHFITVGATTKPLSEGGICMRSTGVDVIIGGLYTDIGITSPSDSTTIVSAFKSWLASQYAAGTPIVIWYVLAEPTTGIVNEPLCKIGDYADELSSTDAGVAIPTVKGNNTLTVGGDLQPSEMTITFKG